MTDQRHPPQQRIQGNDHFGMSRFSIRRYSIQHFLLILLVNVLLATMTVATIRWGNSALVALSVTTMGNTYVSAQTSGRGAPERTPPVTGLRVG